jgi:hypothetical protein
LPKKFFNDFAAALGPELVYLPPQKNFADNNKSPDVALIAKAGSRLNAQSADFKNRMQPYCDDFSKSCVVSAHFSQPNTDDALMALCQSIDSLASELHNHGYKQVTFIGDFNVTAQRLAKICTRWEKRPQLKTTPGAGSSCSDNSGAITPKNIDLLLEFNY